MMKMTPKRTRYLQAIVAVAVILLFPLWWRMAVKWYYNRYVYSTQTAPTRPVAIVFGAGVYANGRLSHVLQDRMETAIALYQAGTVEKLLLSGDNSSDYYNEPAAMMAYALERGVPAEALQADYGGRRTYDSCYRAKYIFGVETAVLVTQAFHLPRAMFTCNNLGIEAVGVGADLRPYLARRYYELRETAATLTALWDVLHGQPAAIMGEPIPLR